MGDVEHKRCSRCHGVLPVSSFARNAKSRDGLQFWCRECIAAWARETRPRKLAQGPLVDEGEKWCRRCETVKRLEDFPLHSKARDGRQTYCRECFAEMYRSKRAGAGLISRPKDVPEGHKFCRGCQQVLPLEQWPRRSSTPDGVATRCKSCTSRRDRERSLVAKYGLSVADIEARAVEQGNLCAICRAVPPVHVDHDHASGEVRGLLCFSCNAALGHLRDDPTTIRRAAVYIEQANRHLAGRWKLDNWPSPIESSWRSLQSDSTDGLAS